MQAVNLSYVAVFTQVVDRRDVFSDAKHHYHECADFLRCVVEAHVITAAYIFFEISDDGTPGSHVPPNGHVSNDKKAEYITQVTQQFVDQYASNVINFDYCALLNNSPEDGTDGNVEAHTRLV